MDERIRRQLILLITRLERLSADSYWAHQASGLRGSLLRTLEDLESGLQPEETRVQFLLQRGFFILEQAARERSGG